MIVASGTAGAQLIAMVSMPFVTRLYGPEALGVLGSFLAVLAILAPIATLGFPIAIILPKLNAEAKDLAHLSLKTGVIASLFVLVFFAFFEDEVLLLTNLTSLKGYTLLLPIALIFTVAIAISNHWVIRHKLFALNAKIIVLNALIINVIKVILGLYIPFSLTLICLMICTLVLNFSCVYFSLRREGDKKLPIGFLTPDGLVDKYKQFPLYRAPQGLITSLNQNIPTVMVASLFGLSGAAFYALTRTVLFLPINLIAKSVGDVLYQQLTEKSQDAKAIFPLIKKSTYTLISIGIFPLIFLFAYAPELFSFVFGEQWYKAGEYCSWLSILFFFNFINRPSVAAVPVLKLERLLLLNSLLNFLISIPAFILGAYFFNEDVDVIALYSFVGILPQLILILFVLYRSKKHDDLLEK